MARAPAWARPYIGIPFVDGGRDMEGCDCYGLGHLVLARERGVMTPAFSDQYTTIEDHDDIDRLVAGEKRRWQPIEKGAEQSFDWVLFRIEDKHWHVGIVAVPGIMLHILEGINSAWEEYRSRYWLPKLRGFYRWGEAT